ncbi:APC family permease [Priestia taiwanensis]|uniref:Serine/threonine exchanger SteT n=1 Tax=Priestia taiwanensis TaxID=1347902 RepID=A0A917AMI0_9BACI|nr:amino acid permease [Priestia taiwanensis]MBM7362173.1 APA family basic amino acid/polyamine antiporter [Priestia taiwanensis]GGE59974.1 serine/threonine exchanger SteT [Priestia taiwanensis]
MEHQEATLQKRIGFSVALSIVIGTIIGSGVFMKPGSVLAYSGGSTMAIAAWVIGGILTLAGGLTVAEVGAQIPKTGGLYVYLEEVYGEFWGYLSGWMQTIIYGPAIMGTLGLYFGSLLVNFFSLHTASIVPLGIGTVVFLGVVNIIGTKYGGAVQTITTVGKLAPIALIIIFGLWKGEAQVFNVLVPPAAGTSIGMAILATLFAYDGWILLASISGEMKNPAKLLPKAIFVGLLVVTFSYVFINIALMKVLPAGDIVRLGENATATAATLLFGAIGGKLISIGIIISIFGCLNGKIMTFPRIPFAMAERGQLPFATTFSRVHPKFHTPANAIYMQLALATIMMLLANPDRLSEISVFIIYLFYVMAFFAVFLLRKKNKTRVYSVPLYPFMPILAIIGSVFVIISTLLNQPMTCILSLVGVLSGLPVYVYLKRI